MNALIYRSAEGDAETASLEAASQHVYDAKNFHPQSRYHRGKAYFLSDITTTHGGFLLPNVRRVESDVLLALYRRGLAWRTLKRNF